MTNTVSSSASKHGQDNDRQATDNDRQAIHRHRQTKAVTPLQVKTGTAAPTPTAPTAPA